MLVSSFMGLALGVSFTELDIREIFDRIFCTVFLHRVFSTEFLSLLEVELSLVDVHSHHGSIEPISNWI